MHLYRCKCCQKGVYMKLFSRIYIEITNNCNLKLNEYYKYEDRKVYTLEDEEKWTIKKD